MTETERLNRQTPRKKYAERGGLTVKEQAFCGEYLVDLNVEAAAVRAGYAPRSARSHAHEILRRPRVQAYLKTAQQRLSRKLDATPEKTLAEWATLAYSNIGDYVTIQGDGSAVVDLSQCDREQMAAVSEIVVDEYQDGKGKGARQVKRTRIKLHSKPEALNALSKHLGLFEEDNKQRGLEAFAAFISGRLSSNATERKQVENFVVVPKLPDATGATGEQGGEATEPESA